MKVKERREGWSSCEVSADVGFADPRLTDCHSRTVAIQLEHVVQVPSPIPGVIAAAVLQRLERKCYPAAHLSSGQDTSMILLLLLKETELTCSGICEIHYSQTYSLQGPTPTISQIRCYTPRGLQSVQRVLRRRD